MASYADSDRLLTVQGLITYPDTLTQAITSTHISSFNIDEDAGRDVPIGAAPASHFLLKLDNSSGQWEPGGSLLGAHSLDGAKIEIEIGLWNGSAYDYSKIGTYYVEDVRGQEHETTITLSGSDAMILKMSAYFADAPGDYPRTIGALLVDVAAEAGVTLESSTFTNSNVSITAQPNWRNDLTCRDVVGYIAACAGGIAKFNRDGKLDITTLERAASRAISTSVYKRLTRENTTFGALNAINIYAHGAPENTAPVRFATTPATPDTSLNSINIKGNPILANGSSTTSSVGTGMLTALSGMSFRGATFDWHGDPSLVLGKICSVTDLSSNSISVLITKQTIKFDAGFEMTSGCDVTTSTKADASNKLQKIFTPTGNLNAEALAGNIYVKAGEKMTLESGSNLNLLSGGAINIKNLSGTANVINMDSTGLTLSSTGQLKLQSTDSIIIGGSPFSVGGTNLIQAAHINSDMNPWKTSVDWHFDKTFTGMETTKLVSPVTGSYLYSGTYTLSFYARGNLDDSGQYSSVRISTSPYTDGVNYTTLAYVPITDNLYKRVEYTFTLTSAAFVRLEIYNHDFTNYNTRVYFRRPKFELGNVATEWSPSPQDTIDALAGIGNQIGGLQTQVDGKIESWWLPTASDPSVNWTTSELKTAHTGDMWYNTTTKKLARWNGTTWESVIDQGAVDAYALAETAKDTADGKRRVFVSQPVPPYDIGDLWAGGSTGDLKRCSTAKAAGGAYAAGDWVLASKYTDDTTATAAAAAATAAQGSANTANGLLADIAADTKLTPVEKKSVKKEWDIIVGEKPKIDAEADEFSVSKTTYGTAYNTLSTYITPLLSDLNATSTIVAATFRTNFKNYYDARQDLLNAITSKAKQLADNAQSDISGFLTNTLPGLQARVQVFYQASKPTYTAVGDLWYDTDSNPLEIWKCTNVSTQAHSAFTDPVLTRALSAATTAQNTANSKITTFVGNSTPTALAAGDLWMDTGNKNIWKRATAAGTGGWVQYLTAAGYLITTGITIDGTDLTVKATGNLNLAADGNLNVQNGGNLNVLNGGDIEISNGGEINVASGGKINITTANDLVLGAQNITAFADGRISAAANTIDLSANNSIKLAVSGSVNLRPESLAVIPNNTTYITVTETTSATYVYRGTKAWRAYYGNPGQRYLRLCPGYSFTAGSTYTISCYVRASSDVIDMGYYDADNAPTTNTWSKVVITGTSYSKCQLTFVPSVTGVPTHGPLLSINPDRPAPYTSLSVSGIQLEYGNIATAWSPSPEDPASGVKTSYIDIATDHIDISTGGSVNISAGSDFNVRAGKQNKAIGISNNEANGYMLWAGSDNPTNAPFRVTMDGELTASSIGGNLIIPIANGGTGYNRQTIHRGTDYPSSGFGQDGDLFIFHNGQANSSWSAQTLTYGAAGQNTYFGVNRNWNEVPTAGFYRFGNGVGSSAYDWGAYAYFTAPAAVNSLTFTFNTAKYFNSTWYGYSGTTTYKVALVKASNMAAILASTTCYANQSQIAQTVTLTTASNLTQGDTYYLAVFFDGSDEKTNAGIVGSITMQGKASSSRTFDLLLKSAGQWWALFGNG